MNEKQILIKNLVFASGAHGLNEEQLEKNLSSLTEVDKFVYTIQKAFELQKTDWMSSSFLLGQDVEEKWTTWHKVTEKYSPSWGFKKRQPGCYVYGLFKDKVPEIVDFLADEVIYIGQSRSVSRNAMLGRRADFVVTVTKTPLVAHSCGRSFLSVFGKDNFDYVYQAYLPLPAAMCVDKETDLLVDYYKKYQKLPACNHEMDLPRIKKLAGF